MLSGIKQKAVMFAIGFVIEKLDEETIKLFLDFGLDLLENAVESSENKIDDQLVLPVCKIIRDSLKIEDNDDPKELPAPEVK